MNVYLCKELKIQSAQMEYVMSKVLVLYTGGTIGSMPSDPNDLESPQRVVEWEKFLEMTPQIDPKCLGLRGDHIGFEVDHWSLDEALDSCNVEPKHWVQMAEIIYQKHDEYSGFVVVHGTDTMVYTASALSFMLINLKKPVVITGSQRSHTFMPRNDGLQNLLSALTIANPEASNLPVIPEVMICFGDALLRGNRSRKLDSEGYIAYESPNYPPLGILGGNIDINLNNIRPVPTQALQLQRRLSTNVLAFDVFPGIQNGGFVERILDVNELEGVVLRSFGTGNIPTDPAFLSTFEKSIKKNGVIVQNTTQCWKGGNSMGIYETSAALLEIGMVSGFDTTPEACLTKMMVLLGNEDLDRDEVAELCQRSIVGESSTSLYTQKLKISGANRIDKSNDRKRLAPDGALDGAWDGDRIENACLRFYGAEVESPSPEEPVTFSVYLNISSDDSLSTASSNYAGSFNRRNSDGKFIVQFDITAAAKSLLKSGERISATVAITNGEGSLSWDTSEISVFVQA